MHRDDTAASHDSISGDALSGVERDMGAMLEAAEVIARSAGRLVLDAYAGGHTERYKGHAHNLVTEIDLASERLIVQELARRFPEHAVRAEEGSEAVGTGIGWFVDPLDGTNNFAHGYPVFSISLAAHQGDTLLVGATYDPMRDEMFTVARGRGAALNGRSLCVSARARLDESLIATGFPYDKASNPDNNLAQFVAVTPHVRGIRRGGSAALDLAYVAAGRLEAYWERGTAAWDVAAGVLMVVEAGGRVTDYDGGPPTVDGGRFVASNGLVHEELLGRLRQAGKPAHP